MSAATAVQRVPTAEASSAMLAAALVRAGEIGVRVNVAVVDSGGNLAGFVRMPGAFLASIDMAIDKAFCAASFGMTTRGFGEYLATAPRSVRDGMLRRPRLTEVPSGCAFHPRCPHAFERCRRERPELFAAGPTLAACWLRVA